MLGEMKAYAHLKPGQDGTKRLTRQYGDKLFFWQFFRKG